MGNTSSASEGKFGAKSAAKEIVTYFAGKYQNEQFLAGKTALITGGNSGIGLETSKALSSAGARIILCSRSVSAGEKAVEEEFKVPGHGGYIVSNPDIVVKQLDLADLDSVKSFADDIIATENRIDFLILNAGIMAVPKATYTKHGFESHIATNHFGHFYLVSLLLDKLKSQDFPSRVVTLSSKAQTWGSVNVNDVHYKNGRKYDSWEAYGQSKSANLLFAKALAEKLVDRSEEKEIVSVSVHPGVISTNLFKNVNGNPCMSFILNLFVYDKTIPQGAASTVWAALAPELADKTLNGSYISDCAVTEPLTAHTQDADGSAREALWVETEKQLKAALDLNN